MTKAASQKRIFTLKFEHLTLEVHYHPQPFNSAEIGHFEIFTLKPKRAPHPLSETGYKSLFIHPEWTKHFGNNPRAFITFALEEAAKKPQWQDHKTKPQQLSLF